MCRKFKRKLKERSAKRRMRKACSVKDVVTMTYYPNAERKSPQIIRKELENLWASHRGAWTIEDTIDQYFRAGCDRASIQISDCVLQQYADALRMSKERPTCAILADKEITLRYLRGMGIPASALLGKVDNKGKMYEEFGGQGLISFSEWMCHYGKGVFIKPIDGVQGRGAYRALVVTDGNSKRYYLNDEEVNEDKFNYVSRNHIVEQLIHQSASMNKLFNGAVNTIRVITLSTDQGVMYGMCHGMIGAGGSVCSNMARGGIVVGIDSDGTICTDGIMKLPPARTHHPDTGIALRGYRIPEFKACVDLAIKAHETLRYIYSIGWDIAVTDHGPIIVEGNADWGTAALTFAGALNLRSLEELFSYKAFDE